MLRLTKKSILLAAILAVSACGKQAMDESGKQEQQEQKQEPQEEKVVVEGDLVSYEFLLAEPLDDKLNALADGLSIAAPLICDIDLSEDGLQFKTYRITYNTVDILGKPIVLSGDVCYIDRGTTGKVRRLESISLFHTSYASTENRCCQYEDKAFTCRAIHNALVVFPHYQGFYAGRAYRVTIEESLLKARQAIDCEIAALQLVEKLDDVALERSYYTNNMGISCGTGPTLATHYLLEQDEALKKVNRDKIHLNSSYCCEGPYKFSEIFTYLVDEFPYEDLQDNEDFSQIALISIVAGTYDTWKGLTDSQGNEFFKGIDDVKVYFDPTLFTRQDLISEDSTMVTDVVEYFREGKLDHHTDMFKNAGLSSRAMINPELFTEDEKLDVDHPLIQALYAALKVNEIITEGWTPQAKLTIAHSTGDELCPYEKTLSVYRSLSDNGNNSQVNLYTTFFLEHTEANQFFAIRDLALQKNP